MLIDNSRYAKNLVNEREYGTVKLLLDDDEALEDVVNVKLRESRNRLNSLISSLSTLCRIQTKSNMKNPHSWLELYTQALEGSLIDSTALNSILDSIKRLPSDVLDNLLDHLLLDAHSSDMLTLALQAVKQDLVRLTSSINDAAEPLKSACDIHHSTLRTTVVAQKISLSRKTATLSSDDIAYTKIVENLSDVLSEYFQRTLIDPSELFLSEVFIYDSKSPHREVFTARPRFAIERALITPHDYLGCECCSSDQGVGLEASQPPVAILYQLYLESGSIINASDLWEAFRTIVSNEGVDDDEEKQRVLTLFSRSLAELRYLGLIKSSRKKVDHLAKLAWQGL